MNEQGPIVVPLDGSELAERVLPLATALAAAERTHIVLVAVWEDTGADLPANVSVELEKHAQESLTAYLHDVRDRLQHKEIRTVVRCGDPSDVILAVADETGARMIVAGSHGTSGVTRWLFGSTTRRLLHESRVPLLVAGAKALEREGTPAIKHVMIPLDGSSLAEAAIEPGIALARRLGAKVSLVRAVRWAFETYPYAGAASYVQPLDSELEAGAREYIGRRQAAAGGTDIHGFVVRGNSADALLAFEESDNVDLVVMTTHARAGLTRMALGSTAERVLQGSAPVLLLRPDGGAGASKTGVGGI